MNLLRSPFLVHNGPRWLRRETIKWSFPRGRASPWVKAGVNTPATKWLRLLNSRRPVGRGQCRHAASSGFTLIEVVLALAIFALMAAILYGAFSLGHSAVAKSEKNSTRNQKQRAVADLLGNYLRSAFPYKESAQDQTVFFIGESDSVTFVSAYSQAMGGRGMATIRLSKEQDGEHGVALRVAETAPVRVSDEAVALGQSHGLTFQADMRAVRFAYLDPQAEDENWQDRWDGRERRELPRAVGISFLNANGEELRWVFPLMMTVLAR